MAEEYNSVKQYQNWEVRNANWRYAIFIIIILREDLIILIRSFESFKQSRLKSALQANPKLCSNSLWLIQLIHFDWFNWFVISSNNFNYRDNSVILKFILNPYLATAPFISTTYSIDTSIEYMKAGNINTKLVRNSQK